MIKKACSGIIIIILFLSYLSLTLALTGCGNGGGESQSPPHIRATENIIMTGVAARFSKIESGFPNGNSAVELSEIYNDATGLIEVFYDKDYSSNFSYAEFDPITKQTSPSVYYGYDFHFPYTFKHDGVYYTLAHNTTTHDGNGNFGPIYLWKSTDKITWHVMNAGYPIVSPISSSAWAYLWNPSAVIDEHGKWTLLVECSRYSGARNDAICRATGTLIGDDLNLTLDNDAVLTLAGNPWIGYIPGKGYIALFGKYTGVNEYWTTQAATSPDGQTWTMSNNFLIEQQNVHICDPHLVETPNGLYMTFSFDQVDSILYKSNITLSEFFDFL